MSVGSLLEAGASTDYPSLLSAYLRGDRQAGESLAGSVRNLLVRRIRHLVGSETLAEDLAQDCLLQIFARLSEFDSEKGVFEAWVGGFALNAARSNRRREMRSRMTTMSVDDVPEPGYEPVQFESDRDLLQAAMLALDLVDREMLHMKYALGMSSDEMAEACGLNAPQVRKRLSRAVERLRRNPAIGQLLH